MVGGRILRGTSGHAQPHRRDDVHGERIDLFIIHTTEDQHKKLDRGGIGGSRRRDAAGNMDPSLPARTGFQSVGQHRIPRQPERYLVGTEWTQLQRATHQTFAHTILLRDRPNQKQNVAGRVLPHRGDDRGLLHKAAAGKSFPSATILDHERGTGVRYPTPITGVCWSTDLG